MSADATDPPFHLCQYDRGYSSVVSTLCQPMRQILTIVSRGYSCSEYVVSADATDPPLCQYDRGYSAVVSTLCQPMRQIHRCVSMTEATQL